MRSGKGLSIIEEKDASEEIKKINEVNSGIYLFRSTDLLSNIDLLANENAQGEYYLPDVVELLCKQEKKVDAVCFNNGVDFQGVNSPIHLSITSFATGF